MYELVRNDEKFLKAEAHTHTFHHTEKYTQIYHKMSEKNLSENEKLATLEESTSLIDSTIQVENEELENQNITLKVSGPAKDFYEEYRAVLD